MYLQASDPFGVKGGSSWSSGASPAVRRAKAIDKRAAEGIGAGGAAADLETLESLKELTRNLTQREKLMKDLTTRLLSGSCTDPVDLMTLTRLSIAAQKVSTSSNLG